MSDLTAFRDHCRRMAEQADATGVCALGTDRDLWRMLADEVDAYLAADDEEVLW